VRLRTRLGNAYAETLFRTGLLSGRRREWPVLLHYHRIGSEAFGRQMDYLTSWGTAVSLDQALACLRGETPPIPGAVVITFDDAYRRVCDEIRPVLTRCKVPATVYLVSDIMESKAVLWFDLVEWAIFSWRSGYHELLPASLHACATPGDALATRRAVLRSLRLCQLEERERLVAEILARAGLVATDAPDRYRLVDWDDARSMQEDELISLGAHTRTHPVLTRLSREQAWDEIAGAKVCIEERLGCAVDHFAYPNGKEDDFDDQIGRMVIEAGYRSAVTTIAAHAEPRVDPYAVPRWGVSEEDTLATFAVKIAGLWPVERARRRNRGG